MRGSSGTDCRAFGKAVGLPRIDRRRVVTTDEFRMFSANGKQQTPGLNCTAKFPRAAARIFRFSLSPRVSRRPLPLPPSSLSLSFSDSPSPLVSLRLRPSRLAVPAFPPPPPLSLSLSLLSPLDRMVMQRTAAAAAAAAASRACVNPAYEGVAPRRRVNMHARRARATRVRLHAYAYGTDASPHRLAGEGRGAQPCSRVLLPVGYTPMQPIPLPRRSLLEIIFFSRGVTRAGETGMVRHRY